MEKVLGLEHILTLRIVNNLGNLYTVQDRLKKAEDIYVQVLARSEKALAPKHILTLNKVNNLRLL